MASFVLVSGSELVGGLGFDWPYVDYLDCNDAKAPMLKYPNIQ